jgi:thiol-disulfide isomerase/thioredoxin
MAGDFNPSARSASLLVSARINQGVSRHVAPGCRNRASLPAFRLLRLGLLVAGLVLASFAPGHAGSFERLDQGELMARVAQARGRVVLVHFWASWCPACLKEMSVLSELRGDYPQSSLILLGVSMDDSEESLSPVVDENEPGYPIYLAGRGVASSFQVSGVPKTVIYNQRGRRVYSTHGFVSAKALRRTVDRLLSDGHAPGER